MLEGMSQTAIAVVTGDRSPFSEKAHGRTIILASTSRQVYIGDPETDTFSWDLSKTAILYSQMHAFDHLRCIACMPEELSVIFQPGILAEGMRRTLRKTFRGLLRRR